MVRESVESATGPALYNAVCAVQIRKKVTLHSTTAINVNVRSNGQKRTCC